MQSEHAVCFVVLFSLIFHLGMGWGRGGGGRGEKGAGEEGGEEEGRKVTFAALYTFSFCFIFQFAKHIVQGNLFA